MGMTSRRKGKVHEREVANELRPLYPGAKRSAAQSRNGRREEDHAADVEGTPYWVECSHGKRACGVAKLAQAKEATDGRTCIAITKRDRGPNIAAMYLPDFMRLLREVEVLRIVRVMHADAVTTAEREVDERAHRERALTPADDSE